jgi:nicotinate-nucleotide adenylyltransferase
MSERPRVGLLGGTFDPIHVGHLAAAHAAGQALSLDTVRFVLSARPPHRTDSPRASEYHRLAMSRLAIAESIVASRANVTNCRQEHPLSFEVSDLELRREGPSFTFDTLTAMHGKGLSALQIFFITGADAFAEIATWYRYPDVLDAANFVVVARQGTTLESLPHRLPALASRMARPAEVDHAAAPQIILLEAHTPDVSSTDIRRRVARGETLDGLVTPAVAAYIAQHSLYLN